MYCWQPVKHPSATTWKSCMNARCANSSVDITLRLFGSARTLYVTAAAWASYAGHMKSATFICRNVPSASDFFLKAQPTTLQQPHLSYCDQQELEKARQLVMQLMNIKKQCNQHSNSTSVIGSNNDTEMCTKVVDYLCAGLPASKAPIVHHHKHPPPPMRHKFNSAYRLTTYTNATAHSQAIPVTLLINHQILSHSCPDAAAEALTDIWKCVFQGVCHSMLVVFASTLYLVCCVFVAPANDQLLMLWHLGCMLVSSHNLRLVRLLYCVSCCCWAPSSANIKGCYWLLRLRTEEG